MNVCVNYVLVYMGVSFILFYFIYFFIHKKVPLKNVGVIRKIKGFSSALLISTSLARIFACITRNNFTTFRFLAFRPRAKPSLLTVHVGIIFHNKHLLMQTCLRHPFSTSIPLPLKSLEPSQDSLQALSWPLPSP